VWHSLGLEFWLLLPLFGLGFWVSSGLLTDRLLARSDRTTVYLQGDRQPKQPSRTVQSIAVVIKARQNRSTVSIETTNSALKQLTFEFPTTEPAEIEAAISRELGLPRDRIRALIHYRVL